MGTYWRSVIIACGLVYLEEFISPGLLSAFVTTGFILKLKSCDGKNILLFPFITLCVVKKAKEKIISLTQSERVTEDVIVELSTFFFC